MVIGLAGKSCSGKNRVASLLEERGFQTIDMDLMAHGLLDTLAVPLKDHFGSAILGQDGHIKRKALAARVFGNPDELKRLEDVLYPELHRMLDDTISLLPREGRVVVNAAALEKDDFWKKCDHILWIEAPFLFRLFRALKRDRRPLWEILKRFRAQKELKSQYFLSRVDTYIIRNSSTGAALRRRVDKWIKQLPPER